LADAANLDATVTANGQPPQGGVSYSWSKQSGPGTVDFSPVDSEDTFARFSAVGSYTLMLTVTSGSRSASDSVDITVNLKAGGGSGLAVRPSNSTECVAPASPPVATRIRLDNPFPGLPALTAPVAMLMAPADSTHWYVVQQTGQVLRFVNGFGTSTVSTFIDINDGRLTNGGEMGLLGMAFHPDYASNGYVYLYYTSTANGRESRISRFNLNATGQALDPASESIILRVAQIDPLGVEIVLPAESFGSIQPGTKAAVIPEIPGDEVHMGSVTIVDRVVDAASGTFGARLELSNPDGTIPSGLHCQVRFLEE